MPKKYEIDTIVLDEEYKSVLEAFETNFKKGLEHGAQVCIYKKGVKVVELAGRKKGVKYDKDSVQIVMSSGKVVTSFVIAYLVDKGIINYEDPVHKYFPEFLEGFSDKARKEREQILIEDILRHDAGIACINDVKKKLTYKLMENDEEYKKFLSQVNLYWSRPEWQKSEKKFIPKDYPLEFKSRLYHATTRGLYLNEVLKNSPAKSTIGKILKEELIPSLDTEEKVTICCANVSEEDKKHIVNGPHDSDLTTFRKLLTMRIRNKMPKILKIALARKSSKFQKHAFESFDMNPAKFYEENYHLESPSFNMYTNARSLATLANSALFKNGGFLSEETKTLMNSEITKKFDFGFGFETAFDKGGFSHFKGTLLASANEILENYAGWGGFGGSILVFDLKNEVIFSYTPSFRPALSLGGFVDERCLRVMDAFAQVQKSSTQT